ncbi:MAG: PDZ domain-containing protein [Halofilum sp. (in: g-proteobacteria)]|nr:PDZ domain-containing protein [Halofilum sp. (in: g-proteobacteria)]
MENRGLLVEDVGSGPLAQAGIRAGDVLLRIGDTALESVDQLRQAVAELPRGKPVPLQVRRGEGTLFVSITIPTKGS